MFFSDEFLATVADDPLAATVLICKTAIAEVQQQMMDGSGWECPQEEVLFEALGLLTAIHEGGLLGMGVGFPRIDGNVEENCSKIYQFLQTLQDEKKKDLASVDLSRIKNRFATLLGTQFSYEFSAADISRIQSLITELREQLTTSELFEEKHRSRLLSRLEKLQAELHKRVSDLDKFWGLIGDAGVAVGKFGTNAKPFVDRIVEISQIVWNTQARAEELPSNTPLPLLANPIDTRTPPAEES